MATPIPHIAVVLGTARDDNRSRAVAEFITHTILDSGTASAETYPVADFALPKTSVTPTDVAPWQAVVNEADAFIMVLPEYNHGYPGEWKLVMDQLTKGYRGKPVVTAAVSSGSFKGARLEPHMLPVYSAFGLIYVPYPIYVGDVGAFADSSLEEQDSLLGLYVRKSVDALVLFARSLEGIGESLDQLS